MLHYKVRYKLPGDPGHCIWSVGLLPNKEIAVEYFNAAVAKEELGPFKIDEAGPTPADYILIEQDTPKHEERLFHLVKRA